MKSILILCLSLTLLSPLYGQNLKEARKGHVTKLVTNAREVEQLVAPPADLFDLVKYPSSAGKLAAYISKPVDHTKKQPAIIWITGGFPSGGGGEYLWDKPDRKNDQSAQQYRDAGMVMMYPTFRGANGNPGKIEGFYGEVDDVISAYDYLSKLSYVDRKKIYLGGHSTGATLALLVAETTDKFRGVICIGGIDDPHHYGVKRVHYPPQNLKERKLRAPIHFLDGVKVPTLIVEGTEGNYDSVITLKESTENKKITFAGVDQADHFNVLYPLNKFLAKSLVKNSDALKKIEVKDIQNVFIEHKRSQDEANDLRTLAYYVSEGVNVSQKHDVRQYLWAENKASADYFYTLAKAAKLNVAQPTKQKSRNGSYWSISVDFKRSFKTVKGAFETREKVQKIADQVRISSKDPSHGVWVDYWEILSK